MSFFFSLGICVSVCFMMLLYRTDAVYVMNRRWPGKLTATPKDKEKKSERHKIWPKIKIKNAFYAYVLEILQVHDMLFIVQVLHFSTAFGYYASMLLLYTSSRCGQTLQPKRKLNSKLRCEIRSQCLVFAWDYFFFSAMELFCMNKQCHACLLILS